MLNTMHRIAGNRWVTLLGLPLVVEGYWTHIRALLMGQQIAPTMTGHEWFDLFVKLMLWLFIWALQSYIRQLERQWKVRRVLDTIIHRYRAEVLYRGPLNFATEQGWLDHLTKHLTEEHKAVKRYILETHPELPRQAVDEALAEEYGTP